MYILLFLCFGGGEARDQAIKNDSIVWGVIWGGEEKAPRV
jgi:hypothetical protein